MVFSRGTLHRQLHLVVLFAVVFLATLPNWLAHAEVDINTENPMVDNDLKGAKIGSKTDDEVIQREAEAMSSTGYSQAEKKLLEGGGETHEFQAEVSRLMGLIINSLYSNRDIFLRELISNSSDALDKIRFLSLTDKSALSANENLEIRIRAYPESQTLVISDSGVGMTKEELVKNLGTIAKSGTSEFLAQAETGNASENLIGQFGVGFYSAFLVADRVTVASKNNDDEQHVWTSTSEGNFSVVQDPEGNTIPRGTTITLHIRDDATEFLDQNVLKGLVSKYSEFITFPIYLWASHMEEREVLVEDDEDDEDLEEIMLSDEEDLEDEPYYETIEEEVFGWELLNDTKPIWTRDPSEISDEEYIAFYKSFAKDEEDPYSWTHFSAEGELEFRSILFLPVEPPSDMFNQGREHNPRGVKLYVRRVYITDDFDAIIPRYLSFIRGVVDSSSLPLNVSREVLQQNRSLKQMEKKIVRKAIAMIQKLAVEDEELYMDFYDDYKLNLKLGVLEDRANQERLAKLLRFYSSKSGNDMVSLEQYVENMKEGQEQIYFLGGESRSLIANSPLLEKLVSKGYEVLYFTDSIDEYWTQSMTSFDGHKLVNVAKDTKLDIDDEDEEEDLDALEEQFSDLKDYMKETLKSKITKCVLSTHLSSSPSAIVTSSYSYTANMERIMKAQALGQGVDTFLAPKKVLEINPKHPLIVDLADRIAADPEDPLAADAARLLFDTAALHSGFSLDDPSEFAGRIHRMLSTGLGLEDLDQETAEPEASHSHDEL